jgi:Ca2+-binding EF-hand superfamily protein
MANDTLQRKLHSMFRMLDLDSDGYLDRKDAERLAGNFRREFGWSETSDEYRRVLDKHVAVYDSLREFADTNRDGKITIEEWTAHWHNVRRDPALFNQLLAGLAQDLFDAIDGDRDGKITVKEYKLMFRLHDQDDALAVEAFDKLDQSGSGKISKVEYVERLREFYTSEQADAPGNWLLGTL